MGKTRRSNDIQSPIEKELVAIKRLMILFLIKTGASLDELALALQKDRADVSRMMPGRKIKKYKDLINAIAGE